MIYPKRGIVVKVKGGLGNQLFQYAAALGVASRNGLPLYVDSFTGFPNDPLYRKYRLDLYPTFVNALTEEQALQVDQSSRLERKLRGYRERFRQRYLKSTFDPAIRNLEVKKRVALEGFWISPLYFDDIADKVRERLRTPLRLSPFATAFAEKLRTTNSVGLHRRYFGLERANANKKAGWNPPPAYTLGDDYYRKAISHLRAKLGSDLTVYIFSDAPDRAANGLPSDVQIEVVNNPERHDYEDLYLLSCCKSHIIANSTFSWWGAWLGQHPDQIVCAPHFFGNLEPEKYLRDVYPPQWTVLAATPEETQPKR